MFIQSNPSLCIYNTWARVKLLDYLKDISKGKSEFWNLQTQTCAFIKYKELQNGVSQKSRCLKRFLQHMKSTPTFCSLGCCTLASLCSLQDQKGIALFSHCIECRQSLGSGNRIKAAGGFLIRYSIRSENWWSQTEHETLQNSCKVTWIWTRSCVECNQVSGKVS